MKIICLNGPPRAGKDTAAGMLKLRGWVELKFSESLKAGCSGLFGVSRTAIEAVKDEPHRKFFGMSWREVQIWMSEEVMKPKFGQDVWSNLMVKRIEDGELDGSAVESPGYVISDLGFDIEYQTLADRFGKENVMVIHIQRRECNFDNDSRNWVFAEDNPPWIINNDCSFHDLSCHVHQAVQAWLK